MSSRTRGKGRGAKAPQPTGGEAATRTGLTPEAEKALAEFIQETRSRISRLEGGHNQAVNVEAAKPSELRAQAGVGRLQSSLIIDRLCGLRDTMRELLEFQIGFSSRLGLITPAPSNSSSSAPETRDINGILSDLEQLRMQLSEHVHGVASSF